MNKTITINDIGQFLSRYEEDIYFHIRNKNDFPETYLESLKK